MIIPSIDLLDGRAVQLVGGKGDPVISADPFEMAASFRFFSEIALIDLDRALSTGKNNFEIIKEIIKRHFHIRFRVGGGIRSLEALEQAVSSRASKIIIGTLATVEFLSQPEVAQYKHKIVAALDVRKGQVVTHGWTEETGDDLLAQFIKLTPYVSEFMTTGVDVEGRGKGADERVLAATQAYARSTSDKVPITYTGGIHNSHEVFRVRWRGIAKVQLGMALYDGSIPIPEAFITSLDFDPVTGLLPTVVQEVDGSILGLVYSSRTSVLMSMREMIGIYYSRSRQAIWRKGATSGNIQKLVDIRYDCDADSLLFIVEQNGDFCHLEQRSCFGTPNGLSGLFERIMGHLKHDRPGYTNILARNQELLNSKILEESQEVVEEGADLIHESADLLYHLFVKMASNGVSLSDVSKELDRRL